MQEDCGGSSHFEASLALMYLLWYKTFNSQMPGAKPPQKVPLVFFRTQGGAEPVRDWLKGLAAIERHAIGKDLLRAQWRWPAGMPLCRPMGQGLWEVRTNLPHNQTARVLLSFYENHLVELHGFIKKTRAIPTQDLLLARRRQKEIEE